MTDAYFSLTNILIGLSVIIGVLIISIALCCLCRGTENKTQSKKDEENDTFDFEVVIPQPQDGKTMDYELEIPPEVLKDAVKNRPISMRNQPEVSARLSFTVTGGQRPCITSPSYHKSNRTLDIISPRVSMSSIAVVDGSRIRASSTSGIQIISSPSRLKTSMNSHHFLSSIEAKQEDCTLDDESTARSVSTARSSSLSINMYTNRTQDSLNSPYGVQQMPSSTLYTHNDIESSSLDGTDYDNDMSHPPSARSIQYVQSAKSIQQQNTNSSLFNIFSRKSSMKNSGKKDVSNEGSKKKVTICQPIKVLSDEEGGLSTDDQSNRLSLNKDKHASTRMTIRKSFLMRQLENNMMFDWLMGSSNQLNALTTGASTAQTGAGFNSKNPSQTTIADHRTLSTTLSQHVNPVYDTDSINVDDYESDNSTNNNNNNNSHNSNGKDDDDDMDEDVFRLEDEDLAGLMVDCMDALQPSEHTQHGHGDSDSDTSINYQQQSQSIQQLAVSKHQQQQQQQQQHLQAHQPSSYSPTHLATILPTNPNPISQNIFRRSRPRLSINNPAVSDAAATTTAAADADSSSNHTYHKNSPRYESNSVIDMKLEKNVPFSSHSLPVVNRITNASRRPRLSFVSILPKFQNEQDEVDAFENNECEEYDDRNCTHRVEIATQVRPPPPPPPPKRTFFHE